GPGDHPLLGMRMPSLELITTDGHKTSTTRLLHPARGILLDLADNAALRHTATPWAHAVDVITATPHALAPTHPLADTDALLLRPDGHIAWTHPTTPTTPTTPTGPAAPTDALTRWFGPAR
ncbi:monooxygenase, partial [Streptomyces sp. NPDC057579]